MQNRLLALVPPEAAQLVLVLFLSFLIGLEREELKRGGKRVFGGVRTFPLLGLMGYVVAYLAHDNYLGSLMGLMVVGAFMVVSYLAQGHGQQRGRHHHRGVGADDLSGWLPWCMAASSGSPPPWWW